MTGSVNEPLVRARGGRECVAWDAECPSREAKDETLIEGVGMAMGAGMAAGAEGAASARSVRAA